MEMPTYLQIAEYEPVEDSSPVVHSTAGSITTHQPIQYHQPAQSQRLSHIEIELSNRGVVINGDIAGDQDVAGVVREAMNHWFLAERKRQQQEERSNNPTIAQQDWLMGLGAVVACGMLAYFGIGMFSNRIPTNPVPTGNYYQQIR